MASSPTAHTAALLRETIRSMNAPLHPVRLNVLVVLKPDPETHDEIAEVLEIGSFMQMLEGVTEKR